MNSQPLVSIALATYNGEAYLRQQLDSIFNQTYKNIEVIVVDDCSTDKTVEILNEYKQKHNLLYYINDYNLGYVKNFEKAVSFCTGEYIALSDQDDIWLENKVETLLNEIKNFTMVCSDSAIIDQYGNVTNRSSNQYAGFSIPEFDNHKTTLIFRNFVTGCTSMFKRDLLANALPIPERMPYHDWWFAIIASRMNGINYITKQLTQYRIHSNNDTGLNTLLARTFRFILPKYKKTIVKDYEIRKKIPEILLKSNIKFDETEKQLITETYNYFNTVLNPWHSFNNILFEYKYKQFLFSKKHYFYLALLKHIMLPLFCLY